MSLEFSDTWNSTSAGSLGYLSSLAELDSSERLSKVLILATVPLLIFVIVRFLTQHNHKSALARQFVDFSRKNACEVPGKPLRYSLLSSLRNKLLLFHARKTNLLDNAFGAKFRTYGSTHVLYDSYGLTRVCHTLEPANVHAVMTSNSRDYRAPDARLVAIGPIESRGVVVTEGALWLENRKAINVGFRGARDTGYIEAGVQELFANLEKEGEGVDADGWTDPFLMFHTFAQMTLDRSTRHMFGVSSGLQESEGNRGDMHTVWKETTDTVARYVGVRSLLGRRAWLWDSREFRAACARLRGLCDLVIGRALQDAKDGIFSNATFVGNLVQETADAGKIRDVVLDLFVAGHNMTSGVLSWYWFELERHPDVFQSLRKEVLETFGTESSPRKPMTYENLQQCPLLHNSICEAMRLYPTLPSIGRQAIRDTVLPSGGGSDGKSPMAIAAGTTVMCSLFQMHRRTEEWGEDTNEFKPERWVNRTPGHEYAPFGGGPRVCPGQLFGMVELFYTTARLLQKVSDIRVPKGQTPVRPIGAGLLMPPEGARVQFKLVG